MSQKILYGKNSIPMPNLGKECENDIVSVKDWFSLITVLLRLYDIHKKKSKSSQINLVFA